MSLEFQSYPEGQVYPEILRALQSIPVEDALLLISNGEIDIPSDQYFNYVNALVPSDIDLTKITNRDKLSSAWDNFAAQGMNDIASQIYYVLGMFIDINSQMLDSYAPGLIRTMYEDGYLRMLDFYDLLGYAIRSNDSELVDLILASNPDMVITDSIYIQDLIMDDLTRRDVRVSVLSRIPIVDNDVLIRAASRGNLAGIKDVLAYYTTSDEVLNDIVQELIRSFDGVLTTDIMDVIRYSAERIDLSFIPPLDSLSDSLFQAKNDILADW
uniref:Uncharacterized protein n=1 Tax=viral metagenome TaxID=1070528 RepID=A0A6C0BL43_9ZZZZ